MKQQRLSQVHFETASWDDRKANMDYSSESVFAFSSLEESWV